MMISNDVRSTLDRATFTITLERTLSASREQVFDAWTNAEHVKEWWDPTGTPLVRCSIDLRVGGAFRFENAGHSPPFEGAYRVVERPAKIVFEALGSIGTVQIESRGTKTHLTVTIRCASAEHLEKFIELGVDTNTNRTLDNLVAHVGRAPN